MAARLQGADHFQVLGVPREAEVGRIKAAYFQLARACHPDAAPAGEPPEGRALRAEIFSRVAAAWGVLEDAARRSQYLEELKSGLSAQVDISRIYQAEQAFEKVAALVAGRAYAEALQRVNEAIGFYPEEPEYAMWKAWLEFLLAPEAERKHVRGASERALEAALRRSPKCAAGHLFLGRMAKLSGDVAAAERHWRRGLAEIPDPELERELRFLKR
jgi:curved DNA-binding protein CbpA